MQHNAGWDGVQASQTKQAFGLAPVLLLNFVWSSNLPPLILYIKSVKQSVLRSYLGAGKPPAHFPL